MSTVFCADCGTECALVNGRDVDARDPEIADVRVWACPVCPGAWAHHAPSAETAAASPAGAETRNARDMLAEQMPCFVQTTFDHGMTREHADRLIALLSPPPAWGRDDADGRQGGGE